MSDSQENRLALTVINHGQQDLIGLDLLRSHLENELNKENFENEEQLPCSLRSAFDKITREILNDVIDSTVKRLYLCAQTGGNLFEHRLITITIYNL